MNFEETVRFLEKLQESRMRLSLEPSIELLHLLGRPDQKLKSILVGGTNGKGSTCAFLTHIAMAAGLKVGTYTSPHLESVTERILINNLPLNRITFSDMAQKVKGTIEESKFKGVTYFEFLTMMAAVSFEKEKVDLAIFEVGLGGRLDTTNTLERIGVIITKIGFDHMQILGNSLPLITKEKAAIMRKDKFVIVAQQEAEVLSVLKMQAQEVHAHLIEYGKHFQSYQEPLNLLGNHQKENAASAKACALELQKLGFKISSSDIEKGIFETHLPGRLEVWKNKSGKEVWIDVAHNRDSMDALVAFAKEKWEPIDLLVGMLADKEWKHCLQQLSTIGKSITLTVPPSDRAWNLIEVKEQLKSNLPTECIEQPGEALKKMLSLSNRILCTGSFYLIGEIRKLLRNLSFTN